MKRIGFITDDIEVEEPISRILNGFNSHEEFRVETIDRLNPELPTISKIQSLIEMCDVILFFISNGSPNIYYEIGLAQGSNKNVILIARSHGLIPLDLSHQRCIIMDGKNFDEVGYEIFKSIDQKQSSKFIRWSSYLPKDHLYDTNFTEYAPGLTYRDLYAFFGPKRHKLFEQWFSSLAKNVKQWKVIESEQGHGRDTFDFMLWNSTDDPELRILGNPIPVELKALNAMNSSELMRLAEKLKTQGLRSLILATTAKNRRNSTKFANRLKHDYGILIVALDRDDLIDIETPKDLYFAIKKQLLNIVFKG